MNHRHAQLAELARREFKPLNSSINAALLKQTQNLLTAVLMQRSAEMMWDINTAELRFEVMKENDEITTAEVKSKCGLLLKDLTLVGWQWDASKKVIIKTEAHVNKLPPVLVYAALKDVNGPVVGDQVRAYMSHLRQCYITSIPMVYSIPGDSMAFITFDSMDEINQSRRLQRPIQVSNGAVHIQGGSVYEAGEISDRTAKSQSLSVAGQSIKQNLLRANNTLSQIREVGNTKFPAQESQLSFKPMSPNAPPLPPDLQTLVRSKPLD